MKRSVEYSLILAVLVLAGCASANYISTGQEMQPKAEDCDIEIFTSKLPDRDYDEIGVLEGKGFLGADSLADILPKMKAEGCKAGGDAIILTSRERASNFDGEDALFTTATVVVWVD